jgi:microsomal dipeptidase-like Zn-dependent dipeptidase
VDVAHASDKTTAALIEAAAPAAVIDSHTTSRSLVPRCRGQTDANLLRLAASADEGGAIILQCRSRSTVLVQVDAAERAQLWYIKPP